MRQGKGPFCQKNLKTQSIPSHFENRAGQGPISSKESIPIYSTEAKEIQNFPVVRISHTKTFRTERVNRFCDKNAPRVCTSLLQTCHFYHEKYSALMDNCLKLIQVEPIKHDVANICFSHARFYKLRKGDLTLGSSKEHLIKEIFDPEYER